MRSLLPVAVGDELHAAVARVRRRLARSPWIYWSIVGVLAVLAGGAVARAAGNVDAARQAWGDDRVVAVATETIEPGESLTARVAWRPLPAPLLPPAAVDDEAALADATARQRVSVGEVIVDGDIVAAGPLALVPAGWVAVPVAEAVVSTAVAGDRVDVAADGVVVTSGGVVIERLDHTVVIAVRRDDAAMVAAASVSGSAVVVLVG